jgi:hypothetical protein
MELAKEGERPAVVLGGSSGVREDLPSRSVLTQTASVRQEIDCTVQSNYS